MGGRSHNNPPTWVGFLVGGGTSKNHFRDFLKDGVCDRKTVLRTKNIANVVLKQLRDRGRKLFEVPQK